MVWKSLVILKVCWPLENVFVKIVTVNLISILKKILDE